MSRNGPGDPDHGVDFVTSDAAIADFVREVAAGHGVDAFVPVAVRTSADAPWGYADDGVPCGPDGVALWSREEYGTRGPPWRASLLHPERATTNTDPATPRATASGVSGGEKPGRRDTIERFTNRVLADSPKMSREDAKKWVADRVVKRYDRRHGG